MVFYIISGRVEILEPKVAKRTQKWNISPPERIDAELRVIVWQTKDVKFHDLSEKCNDLYARGEIDSQILETDTHWRCRNRGSFNYRWKFPMVLPIDRDNPEEMYKDKLKVLNIIEFRYHYGTGMW